MKFTGYIIKRKVENVLMFPFILVGRLLSLLDPLPKEYKTYFFFPFYHTGGAEKVHALITKATGNSDCIIFFTRKSTDKTFLNEFAASGCEIRDISNYVDNKWLYFLKFFWRGKISQYINQQKSTPVIFNGQSNFGYKISPWIKKSIKQVELIHSFNSFSWIRIPFIPFIAQTVMISRQRIEQHLQQYNQVKIPAKYADRIVYIQNAIELPVNECRKTFEGKAKALFAGRGTSEKRPEIFIEIARQLPSVDFTLVGEMPSEILESLPPNVTLTGNISDPVKLDQLYCSHHLLIIPSSTEGFPIVLMEGMARGCIVMATPVGDIPYHIDSSNGFVFSTTDRETVIQEAIEWINKQTMESLPAISSAAKQHAFKNFGIRGFNQQYKTILQR